MRPSVLVRGCWANLLPWAGYGLLLFAAPLFFSSGTAVARLSQMGCLIIICLSYNMQLGQGGLLSFCHAVFAGTGGFAVALMLGAMQAAGMTALPLPFMPLVGGLAAALLALPLGFIATRRAGIPFAMITLGIGAMVTAIAAMLPAVFGGDSGISLDRVYGRPILGWTFGPSKQLYYLIAAYCLVCTALMHAFAATPLGRVLNAVRDHPERAAFLGYNVRVVRWHAVVLASFFAGVGGALATLQYEIFTADDAFGFMASGHYLFFTVLGGTAVFYGPILGAVLMVFALNVLADHSAAWMLYLGLCFMLMVMFVPGGAASVLQRHGQALRAGHAPLLLRAYGLAAPAVGALTSALILLVEMGYRLRASGPSELSLGFAGWSIDAAHPLPWIVAVLLAAVSAAALRLVTPVVRRAWAQLDGQVSADLEETAA